MEFIIGISSSIVGKVTEFGVEPLVRRIGYFLYYKRNVERLKDQIEGLKLARERLDHSVAAARDNCEVIEGDVQHWLSKADSISGKAEQLLVPTDEDQANTSFSRGSFSRLIKRYKISKEAKNTVNDIAATIEQAKAFGKVSYCLPPSHSFKIKGYEEFETRACVVLEVMEALRDASVRTIGVWGMGGVGKTMLVKEVARQAKCENLFSRVVFITISQTPDCKRIQQEVAETLGLHFKENIVALRAKQLRDRLSSEKKILVIIDDIWSKLEMEDIGIFFAEDQKACKIVLISRSQDVLCNDMDVDRNFNLGVLHESEATNLFDQIAGDLAEEREFQKVKRKILRKCAGLPLAISVLAKALKNKSISIWDDALQELKTSNPVNIKGVEKEVYSVIKLSYDYLQSEEAKSILVLCGLHKEDENISIEELLMHGMGLRLFHGIEKLKDARNRVFHLVDILKSASLLLDARTENYVRMHDVIRNIVLSIASKEKQMNFISNEDDVNEKLNNNELRNSKAIALSSCRGLLLETRVCTKLQLFSLVKSKLEIQDKFFEGAEELKVLGLRKVELNPSSFASFRSLNNLKTLIASRSKLGSIESIGELKCLEMLDLSGSDVKILPKQLGNLTRLLSLNLSYCDLLEVIEPGILSSYQKLQELHMKSPSFTHWAPLKEVSGNSCSNACLTELKQARHLSTFYMDIPDADNLLSDGLFTDTLETYRICVTSSSELDYLDKSGHRWSRSLSLDGVSDSVLEHMKLLIKSAENLHLSNLNISNAFFGELGECGYLKGLKLMGVHTARYISFNTHGCKSPFQHLEELYLADLAKLETISNGCELPVATMAKLRVIVVQRCHSLKNLFPLSSSYAQLEKLMVVDCEAMEHIFIHIKNDDEMVEFPLLRLFTLERTPKLKQFFVGSPMSQRRYVELVRADVTPCNDFPLFNHNVVFPALNKLTLVALDSVMMIWPNDHNELQYSQSSVNLNKLKKVEVSHCSSLKSLFPASLSKALHELESLRLEYCGQLQEIIAEDEGAATIAPKFAFPQLSSLHLSNLPELERLYHNMHFSEWPSLGELTMEECGKVKILASQLSNHQGAILSRNATLFIMDADAVAFPKLKKIDLAQLDQLEMIWHGNQERMIAGSFGELEKISIKRCNAIVHVYSLNSKVNLESLIELTVDECAEMEKVFELQRPTSADTNCERVITPLTSLRLSSLPKLKHVWRYKDQCHPQSLRPGFITPKLKKVEVTNCQRLKSLFPASVAEVLLELESIQLKSCGQMQEIISEESKAVLEIIPKFKFPKLASMSLRGLRELKHFYPGLHTSEWPSLSNISLEKCGKLKILASALSTFRRNMVEEAKTNTPLFLMETVGFPKLKAMNLNSLDRLAMIWHGDPAELIIPDSFSELERVSITHCRDLIQAFPLNNLGNLRSLTQLMIKNCYKLEEVFEVQRSTKIRKRVVAPLTFLTLHYLPKLKHVWSHKDQFNDHFEAPKLKIVYVVGCQNLASLFPASIAIDLLELESIRLEGCDQMREIIAEEKEAAETMLKFEFPRLTSMSLGNLPKLKHFYPGLHASEWPSLQSLSLLMCDQVKILASHVSTFKKSMSQGAQYQTPLFFMEKVAFPKLKKINLFRLDHLAKIWQGDRELFAGSFGKLEEASMTRCDSMLNAFSLNLLENLESLTELTIDTCTKMEEVFETQSTETCCGTVITPLTSLRLSSLPKLKHVWPYKDKCHSQSERPSFITPKLKKVDVTDCPSLKSLFPASLAKDLFELESIQLESCNQMQQIISDQENEAAEIIPKFEFPKLTSMSLSNLRELKSLYPGLHTSEWPSLGTLVSVNCVKVKILASQLSTFEMNMSQEARNETLFMMETVMFPNLNVMILNSFEGLERIWKLGDHVLEEKREPLASQLSILILNDLPNSKGFLFPSSTSFKHLTTLAISGCDIKSLFAPSTARSMPQLTALTITTCESMVEVIGDEPEKGEIAFNKLEVLGLVCLPKLVCFHTGNYTLVFPNLEQLVVLQCPEMRSFSCKAITPKLKEIITRLEQSNAFSFKMWYDSGFSAHDVMNSLGRGEEQHWDGDINSTLQKLYYSKPDCYDGVAATEDGVVDVPIKITEMPEAEATTATECHETRIVQKF